MRSYGHFISSDGEQHQSQRLEATEQTGSVLKLTVQRKILYKIKNILDN